jgi:acylphosphatase
MALKQVQLFVRGRVQGVYFRASTQREARRLGLTGWVKNRPDGSVEIVAEGEEVSIRELYGWAQKGPSAARVDRVETRWRSYTGILITIGHVAFAINFVWMIFKPRVENSAPTLFRNPDPDLEVSAR